MYIFSGKDIYKNLPYTKCIELMQQCFEDLGNKLVGMSPKHATLLPDNKSLLGVMTGHQLNGTFAIIKSIGLFSNSNNIKSSHQGVISLYNYKKGEMLAIFDAASITAIRTASASALATKNLAHPDASTLSLIGAGEQSFHQTLAISKIRNIKKVNVFNRTSENSKRLKKTLIEKGFSIPINIYPLNKIKKISKEHDIISISTSSPTPLLMLNDLPKGCHINSIGACTPNVSEIDPDIVNTAYLVVDDIITSNHEAGNLINSKNKTFSNNSKELKETITTTSSLKNELTLFNSTGLGIQDLYCAIHLYRNHQNIATANIDLEGHYAE